MRQTIKGFMLLVLIALLSITGYLFYVHYRFAHEPMLSVKDVAYGNETSIKVYPNTNLHRLANELHQRRLWDKSYSLQFLAKLYGLSNQLRFGEYAIKPGMSVLDLLENMHTARGLVTYDFRIREGWTQAELLEALHLDSNFLKSQYQHTTLLKQLELNYPSLEGLLYPDTYHFVWGSEAFAVIQLAHQKMRDMLARAWAKRDKKLPIKDAYQALIVASLIQTEAALKSERPKVAAVIYNRLRKHMRLQIDPTVIYGLGLPYGTILNKHQLKIQTPYNTYRIQGLPPTPIAFPTWTAIEAAVHPSHIKALYFVAKGDGTHTFSDSYHKHQKATSQYRELTNQRKWQLEKQAARSVLEVGLRVLFTSLESDVNSL